MKSVYRIAIIMDNKIVDVVSIAATTENNAYDKAFDYADTMYGHSEDTELFNLECPAAWNLMRYNTMTLDFNGHYLYNKWTGLFYGQDFKAIARGQ